MGSIEKFFKKYGLMVITGLLIIIFFRGCGVNTKSSLRDAIANERLDSLELIISQQPTNESIKLMFQIEGLKNEKRTLLNTNQIFLTNKRPDERVMAIDNELKGLE